VGAFRGIQYAQERVARLKAKGYSARIVTFSDPQGGVWHTVRFGDHFTLELARDQAEIFSLRENMETIVRPYHAF
jgi:cell division protein FtsN